ncbi:MAG: phasin family protein [Pseudomonadota bacterium]
MYTFSHSVSPAVRSHLDAQISFHDAVLKSLSRSFQNWSELNFQLGRTVLEEGDSARQKLLNTASAIDAIEITSACVQPTAEKLQAYQQHISRIVAEAQFELSAVINQYTQLTATTSRDLADQVTQVAAEETEKICLMQREMMENLRVPAQQQVAAPGNGSVDSESKRGSRSSQGIEQGSSPAKETEQSANEGSAKSN